ncbi:DNA polymerase III subunit epsilon [Larsenimonas salina]|uniref:DNA polymerase III subunit epsilon n=1 Tax=Larsenimonas salina TaxID=1295565 RepID=UPI0020734F74|nr:DNA polymerase III subunit epsilon [Larsenimonas salina]MCM5703374.1 DNA polymerase III subunit epsilon [Larsenimonas salina]
MAGRSIVLDTETTGIDPKEGHRLVEIGAVEVVNRRFTGRVYHQYINPERHIDDEVVAIHGIDNAKVANEPTFREVADEFWTFIQGAELIIHNAAFDVGFLDFEFDMLNKERGSPVLGPIKSHCSVLDTLKMARDRHPGQRNNLDALCKRYDVNNSHRELHGALLDAEILADVYLAMTGGQTALVLGDSDHQQTQENQRLADDHASISIQADRQALRVVAPTDAEWQAHRQKLDNIRSKAGSCFWDTLTVSQTERD